MHKGQKLEPAKRYRVTHRDNDGRQITATRLYKWHEVRFGDILCFVFTSRVNKDVEASFSDNKITMRGKRLPMTELSIPLYDLVEFKAIN